MELNNLTQQHKEVMEKLEGQSDQVLELAQKLATASHNPGAAKQSVGKIVAESNQMKAFIENGGNGSARVNINQAITSAGGSAGPLIWSDREEGEIVRLPRRAFTIRQLLTQGRTSSNLVEYTRQVSRDNQAAPVAEEALKPTSDYVWELADAAVKTIAHIVPISRQVLDDVALLESEVNSEMRYGLDLEEESQILAGDGIGQNLSGLIPNAEAFVAAFVPASETVIDRLRLGMLQLVLEEYMATGVVLHPTDWAKIELQKDADNRYIVGNPFDLMGARLWGMPVVPTQAIAVNNWLMGDMQMARNGL